MTETQNPDELELELLPLAPALEAVLMVADQPLDHLVLAQAVGHPPTDVQETLVGLAASYDEDGRGFELRHVAGGWRFYTREAFAPAVERFVLDGQQARLTQAALETVAVVAYRQPVSRARVSAIRGVNVDGVMRTLVTRGLVAEVGHDAESGATLYGTTAYFCERMGLASLDELPEIAPFLPAMGDVDDEPEVLAEPLPAPADEITEPQTTEPETTEPQQEQHP
jgi:segregation and condensation protein B